VSRSSAEAEYRSMAAATCELKWLKGLLSSHGVEHVDSMNLYNDSQSALHIANNLVLHERTVVNSMKNHTNNNLMYGAS